MNDFLTFAAAVLGVPMESLSPETAHGSIPQWDSIAQIRLVMEMEARYGVRVPLERVPELKTIADFYALLPVRKVLALDLDGTLWDGVVSEDGPSHVVPRREFQLACKELAGRGVLLVAVSANDAEDVEPMWSDPRMILKKEDFTLLKINWRPKPENVEEAARELGLATDAFVFVDDKPSNRAAMKSALPTTCVTEFPCDPRDYFNLTGEHAAAQTEEDAARAEMYKARAARIAAAPAFATPEYLRTLEIKAEIRPATAADIQRLAQMAQKTNRFNVTTHRYSEEEVSRFVSSPDHLFLRMKSRDRFGEHGTTAFVLARLEGGTAKIVDFVMSCRVLDLTLENALEAALEKELEARGVSTILASYAPTEKNAAVADLFPRLGFAGADGKYSKQLPAEPPKHYVEIA